VILDPQLWLPPAPVVIVSQTVCVHNLQPQYVAVALGANEAAPKKRTKEDSLNIFDFLCAERFWKGMR